MTKKKTPIKINRLIILTIASLVLNTFLLIDSSKNRTKINILEDYKDSVETGQNLLPGYVAIDKVLNINEAKQTFCNNSNVMIWTDDLGTSNTSWKVGFVQGRSSGNYWLGEYRVDKETGTITKIK